jgi:hypothetical protein
MKRALNILTALALSAAVATGCSRFEDPVFDESSAQRVENLMSEAFSTLTSSPEGWYFEFYQGWNSGMEEGGYWFWLKFNTDYTVDAACEIPAKIYRNTVVVESYEPGTVKTSAFQLIKGRGAVLSFDTFNPIIHFMANPDWGRGNGREGDFEFTIVSIEPDVVTVRGIKTDKLMRLVRKTDNKPVAEAMREMQTLPGATKFFGTGYTTTVKGAYTNDEEGVRSVAIRQYDRNIHLTYNNLVEYDEKVETSPGVYETQKVKKAQPTTVKFSFITNRDKSGVTLGYPVNVMGQQITAFDYDEATRTFTSNDPDKTVTLTEVTVPINEYFRSELWNMWPTSAADESGDVACSTSYYADWSSAKNYLTSEWGFQYREGAFGETGIYDSYSAQPGMMVLFYAGQQGYYAHYYFTFTPVAGTNNELSIALEGGDGNASYILNAFLPLLMNINDKSPFVITTDGTTHVRLTSKADPNYYFSVTPN